jgi:GTPase SAR1 family protein
MTDTGWLKDIYSYGSEDIPMILIGNKSDLTTQRVVSESQAIALAQHYGLKYLEASAKLGTGVNEAFISLASDIMNKK